MTDHEQPPISPPPADRSPRLGAARLLIKILLPVIFIGLGVAGWAHFKNSAPKIQKKPHQRQAPVVKTIKVFPSTHQQVIQAMGTVRPDRQISLKSRVAGQIIWVSPQLEQGSLVKKGDPLITIDPSDYEIEVKKAQSALDKALAALAIEQGNQSIARAELKMINEAADTNILPTDLSLRKPQLLTARAAVDNARADLEKAELNLERTRITAPFNALILEKNVCFASQISTQEVLAVLVNTDRFTVEAQVAQDKLYAIDLTSDNGCRASIYSQAGKDYFDGTVHGTTGKISEKSRMAGIIIKVTDPLGIQDRNGRQPLMIGDYVTVDIYGKPLENVMALPRAAVREDNTVWIYRDGRLFIATVTIRYKAHDLVYIDTGLNPGDEVITTDLATPVSGMNLKQAGRES